MAASRLSITVRMLCIVIVAFLAHYYIDIPQAHEQNTQAKAFAQRSLLSIVLFANGMTSSVEQVQQSIKHLVQRLTLHLAAPEFQIIIIGNNAHKGKLLSLNLPLHERMLLLFSDKNERRGNFQLANRAAKLSNAHFILFLPDGIKRIVISDSLVKRLKQEERLIAKDALYLPHFLHGSFLAYKQQLLSVGLQFKFVGAKGQNRPAPFFRLKGESTYHMNARTTHRVKAVPMEGMLISKYLFDRLNGFDTSVSPLSDADLCLRAKQVTPIWYDPSLRIKIGDPNIIWNNLRAGQVYEPFLKRWEALLDNYIRSKYQSNVQFIISGPFGIPSGFGNEAMDHVEAMERVVPLKTYRGDTSHEMKRYGNIYTAGILETLARAENEKRIYWENWTPEFVVRDAHPGIKYRIGRFMFESDRIPSNWLPLMANVDEIWVPSQFNVDSFADAGVPRSKLYIIPPPIDTKLYNPYYVKPMKIEKKKGYNFLSVFEMTDRKGWKTLLQAFFEEFSPHEDVTLHVKTDVMDRPGIPALVEKVIAEFAKEKFGKSLNELATVNWIVPSIDRHRLPGLYKACDAFVLPSHGEGYGRPYMEAMAMELPVIATNWSGNTAFTKEEHSYLIDYELVEIKHHSQYQIYIGHKWAEASVTHLRQLMRHVFENREEGKAKGVLARKYLRKYFSPMSDRKAILARLKEISKKI